MGGSVRSEDGFVRSVTQSKGGATNTRRISGGYVIGGGIIVSVVVIGSIIYYNLSHKN